MKIVALALSLSSPSIASAQEAPRTTPFDPVYLSTDSGEEANGARFVIGDNCVLVTAHHAIKDTNAPIVRPIRSPQDRASVIKSNERIDVGLALQANAQQRTCSPMPTDAAIQSALFSDVREVWYVTANGDARPFAIDLIEATDSTLTLQIKPNPANPTAPRAFIPGMSGALVVFGGVPVAVLQSADTSKPIASASRLDFIRRQFAESFAVAPTKSPPPSKTYAPYDIAQLPEEYRQIVKQARINKTRAERAEKDALEIRRKAEDASLIGAQYVKDQVVNGYANFTADNGNLYSGQVYQVGIQYGSQGFGVVEVGKGDGVGDKYWCRFVRDEGCEGPGVWQFADNKNNTNQILSWTGNFQSGKMSGFGHLRFRDNGQASEVWLYQDADVPMPGVWINRDGGRYEGEIKTTWDGGAALWDKNGKLVRFGRWSGGKPVGLP